MSAPVYETPTPAPDGVRTTFFFSTEYVSGSVQLWFGAGLVTKAGCIVETDPSAGEFTFDPPGGPATAADTLYGRFVDGSIPDDQVGDAITIELDDSPIDVTLTTGALDITLTTASLLVELEDSPLEVIITTPRLTIEVCC